VTRVFTIHGSTSLYVPSTQNAKAQQNYYIKESFELSDLCDKEFHKMAQNFGMMANYGEPKGKVKSATTGVTQQLEGHLAEPEVKKLWVHSSDKPAGEEEKTSATQVTNYAKK
jgi:hypothetical protein